MHAEEVKSLVRRRVSFFLKESRQRAGLSIETATSRLGYASSKTLSQYEESATIPCCELVRLTENYHLPEESLSDFLIDLQVEVFKLRQR